jgi:hypothetical protein
VVVKPSEHSEPGNDDEAHEAVSQLIQRLQQTSEVEYRQVDDGQGPNTVYAVSILPKGDDLAAARPTSSIDLGKSVRFAASRGSFGASLDMRASTNNGDDAAGVPGPTIELQLGRGGHFTISCKSMGADMDLRASTYKASSPTDV